MQLKVGFWYTIKGHGPHKIIGYLTRTTTKRNTPATENEPAAGTPLPDSHCGIRVSGGIVSSEDFLKEETPASLRAWAVAHLQKDLKEIAAILEEGAAEYELLLARLGATVSQQTEVSLGE